MRLLEQYGYEKVDPEGSTFTNKEGYTLKIAKHHGTVMYKILKNDQLLSCATSLYELKKRLYGLHQTVE